MKFSIKSNVLVDQLLDEIAARYPETDESTIVTDIHLQPHQDTGELIAFNDDDEMLAQVIIEEWANSNSDHFIDEVKHFLGSRIHSKKKNLEKLGIMQPYSIDLVDDDKETISELLFVDGDTEILNKELLKGLDNELNDFLKKLLED